MRTFVALNLPPEVRDAMHAALEPLRAKGLPVRWVEADAMHVTIKFLGDTANDNVPAIDAALRTAASHRAPITLRIAGVGAFPSLRRAEIVWIGIEPDAQLVALNRELEPALSRLGFPREQRPFRPHVTVGRTQRNARAPDIERHAGLVHVDATVVATTVDLMQSYPGDSGSRYEALLRRPLGAPVNTP